MPLPKTSTDDPRADLLAKLERYLLRYPQEKETIEAFALFVHSNPQCFERSLLEGHVCGSAWVVNKEGSAVLLTHHKKIGRWLQLGGHADGDSDILHVALREAQEESGLSEIAPLSTEIFDISIHTISARGAEPEHKHYDVRFTFQTDATKPLSVSDESHALRWVELSELDRLATDPSVLNMRRKWLLARPLWPLH